MRELPEAEREVVELLYSSASPTEREAATILDRSKTRINALRQRGLAFLRKCLERKGIEE